MEPRLGPSSHVILGILAGAGPQTPYRMQQIVGRTVGFYWPFPHAQLYKETGRLAALGMVSETAEPAGRRRKLYSITEQGRAALQVWLAAPTREPAQFRDLGLLKLAFASVASPMARQLLREDQLAAHTGRLRTYQGYAAIPMDRYLRATLELGLRYEAAAVDFWRSIAEEDLGAEPAGSTAVPTE